MIHISEAPPVPKLPPHVVMVKNRTGRPYYYLSKHRGTGREQSRLRLPDDPRSPEFWSEYARLMGTESPKPRTDTVRALATAWQASPEWGQMARSTRADWTRYVNRVVAAWGDLEVQGIEPRHILALRDQFRDTPASANNLLRCLTSMLSWSVPRGWRADNPCREVRLLRGGDGYAPWDWDTIAAVRADLREDLWWVVALALYTGQRQGDVLAMRWDHVKDGLIAVQQEKTEKRLVIPLHRDLRPLVAGIPRRAVTILTSTEGGPWTKSGFKATWNKHKPAVLRDRGLVFHGLRKSAVVTLLEAGCSDAEVASITGQSREMVEHYGKQVNQGRLAAAAVLKWERHRT